MDFIEELKKEHEDIEIELTELEYIMNSEDEDINFSNFIHVFKKLCEIWDKHEEKEEKIFPIMKKERIIIPVKKMLTDHDGLRNYKKAIQKAILSQSQVEMRKVLEKDVCMMIEMFRKHIEDEEKILFAITIELFTCEEIEEIEKNLA